MQGAYNIQVTIAYSVAGYTVCRNERCFLHANQPVLFSHYLWLESKKLDLITNHNPRIISVG